MAVKEPHPRIYGIPLGSDYPREFVNGLIQRYADRPPHELARINVTLIHTDAFAPDRDFRAEQKYMLLPKLHLIGDLAALCMGPFHE